VRTRAEQRAGRIVRLFPHQWRAQFPDFEEVLAAELSERPRGVIRDALRTAVAERLRAVGLIPRTSAERARSGLALIYATLIPFVGLAAGMSSQLRTGLTSSATTAPSRLESSSLTLAMATRAALLALTLAVGILVVDARKYHGHARKGGERYRVIVAPSVWLIGSVAVLTMTGWCADRSRWYSPAAALPSRGAEHFATLWLRGTTATITPAWVHPALFGRMPAGELAAALLTPTVILAATAGLFRLVTLVSTRPPGRAEVILAATAFGTTLTSVVACARWVWEHPTREGTTTLQTSLDQLAPGHTGWFVVLVLATLCSVALVGLNRVAKGGPARPAAADGRNAGLAAHARSAPGRDLPPLFIRS
jgi:hypothetical protein